MKLIVIANEAPYPANHGGRVDVWHRICALKAAGAEIFLIFWSGDAPDELPAAQALARLRQEVVDLSYYVIHRSVAERITRAWRLWRWPSHVASRVLARSDRKVLLEKVRVFRPDAVWLDGIYGGVLAAELAETLAVPLFCRSHNIEHLYMSRQVAKAAYLRDRLAWGLNLLHLRSFELGTLRRAARFFDISMDDVQFWRGLGLSNGAWLPPMMDPGSAARLSAPWEEPPAFDVGYLGNLFAPNNVEGVLWLLEEIVERLRVTRPGLRMFVAGARPVDKIVEATQRHGITLLANPESGVPVLRTARVLVNPVFAGSGVNIKTVEMLFTPAQLVSTTQGLTGLPGEVTRHFHCADAPDAFAGAILQGLAVPEGNLAAERAEARRLFSFAGATELMRSIQQETARFKVARKSPL